MVSVKISGPFWLAPEKANITAPVRERAAKREIRHGQVFLNSVPDDAKIDIRIPVDQTVPVYVAVVDKTAWLYMRVRSDKSKTVASLIIKGVDPCIKLHLKDNK